MGEQLMVRTSVLGGEAGYRSTLGGSVPPWRLSVLGGALAVLIALTAAYAEPGLVVGAAVLVLAWALTQPTKHGSILDRAVARRRRRDKLRDGTVYYQPFEAEDWEALAAQSRARSRKVRAAAVRQAAAVRETPDGADGMGWLERRPEQPGIAYHGPRGEQPYLSVAFEVSGQLRGLESEAATDGAAAKWGRFLYRFGDTDAPARMVQTVTRVLPPDLARHQAWMLEQLDPDVPIELAASYDELVHLVDQSTMIQRHFVAVRWPLTGPFYRAAERYGPGKEGWRRLMAEEVRSVRSALRAAGHEKVEPLTAARLAAVILHMQDPSRPIDRVHDADPERIGVKSRDEYAAHVVEAIDPVTGEARQWWHRTMRIRAQDMATIERSSMWLTPLLSRTDDGTLRTVSINCWMVPASQARTFARLDRTRDQADAVARSSRGRIDSEEGGVRLTAVQRRARDLAPGNQNAGVEWVAHVTITARSREQLARACRSLGEVVRRDLGVEGALEWLDTYQSAASGCTWPIARGLKPPSIKTRDKATDALAGHGAKEAL
ncbi:hypothetical protein GCM10023169_26930 [Georgenia halophila]|uniref:PrgI family protein n=1 Tax=Georgenia halophila TaxID=620889 RepID=A0ABP8LDB8_9MICO